MIEFLKIMSKIIIYNIIITLKDTKKIVLVECENSDKFKVKKCLFNLVV